LRGRRRRRIKEKRHLGEVKMPNYLIDASVMLGFANTKDTHHKNCEKFIDEHTSELFYFPMHTLFEVESGRARRIRANSYDFELGERKFHNVKIIPIDWNIFEQSVELKLFELFDKLRGMDLIYACIAKIKNLTLVTCDHKFDLYTEKLNVLNLAEKKSIKGNERI
jgi:predicted nucleic acid-binding protein